MARRDDGVPEELIGTRSRVAFLSTHPEGRPRSRTSRCALTPGCRTTKLAFLPIYRTGVRTGSFELRDTESEYLDLYTDEEDAIPGIVGASISYRLAFGPNAGKKALTLQTIPAIFESGNHDEQVSKRGGFSLHAGVACKAEQRKKLERLCRYITRPAIAEQRLSLANNGNVIVEFKSPYADGTTHVILSPMEFISRLVSLVPKPRVNLIRFHGVFSLVRIRRIVNYERKSFQQNRYKIKLRVKQNVMVCPGHCD